jgi:hypothetical protein
MLENLVSNIAPYTKECIYDYMHGYTILENTPYIWITLYITRKITPVPGFDLVHAHTHAKRLSTINE